MNFVNSLEWRYTTKEYDKTRLLSSSQLERLMEIVQLSPSSINSQPWKFTFVTDPRLKEELAEVSYFNEQKIKDCQLLVVFSRCDNIEMFEKWLVESQPQGARDYYLDFVKPMPEEQIKGWFTRQLYLALGIFLSGCADLQIDSSPMEGIEPDKYDYLLGEEDYKSVVAVAVGYRAIGDYNQPGKNPKSRRDINDVVSLRAPLTKNFFG